GTARLHHDTSDPRCSMVDAHGARRPRTHPPPYASRGNLQGTRAEESTRRRLVLGNPTTAHVRARARYRGAMHHRLAGAPRVSDGWLCDDPSGSRRRRPRLASATTPSPPFSAYRNTGRVPDR